MNIYTRYKGSDGRLWICIERFGKIEPEHHLDMPKPSSIKMLDVVNEKAHMMEYEYVSDLIKKGKLVQITV